MKAALSVLALSAYAFGMAQDRYHVIDLGAARNITTDNYGIDINDLGQAIIQFNDSYKLYTPGSFLFPGYGVYGLQGYARSLTNSGFACGGASNWETDSAYAVRWIPGASVIMSTGFVSYGNFCTASAINNTGVTVGYAGSVGYHGTIGAYKIRANGTYAPLNPRYGGFEPVYAYDVNDAGDVVGSSTGAVIWRESGGGTFEDLADPAGGEAVSGNSLSNTGWVLGFSRFGSRNVGTVWKPDGTAVALDFLLAENENIYTSEINDSGVAIGWAASGSDTRAYVWREDRGIRDLNTLIDPDTPGWSLIDARGINSQGQIIGTGIKDGVRHAYVATPMAAPEPGSLGALALGVLILRRSKRPRRSR